MTTQIDVDKIDHCPALVTLKVISGKWKTRILWQLRSDEMHFNELRRSLRGVSAKVLTEHLRQLEQAGIVNRRQTVELGVTVSIYSYSSYGATLIPVLDALGAWGLKHTA